MHSVVKIEMQRWDFEPARLRLAASLPCGRADRIVCERQTLPAA